MAALILGKKATAEMYNETGPDSVQTKPDIFEYLKGSFAALHLAVATIDGKNAANRWKGRWLAEDAPFVRRGCGGPHFDPLWADRCEYLRMKGASSANPPAFPPVRPHSCHQLSRRLGAAPRRSLSGTRRCPAWSAPNRARLVIHFGGGLLAQDQRGHPVIICRRCFTCCANVRTP